MTREQLQAEGKLLLAIRLTRREVVQYLIKGNANLDEPNQVSKSLRQLAQLYLGVLDAASKPTHKGCKFCPKGDPAMDCPKVMRQFANDYEASVFDQLYLALWPNMRGTTERANYRVVRDKKRALPLYQSDRSEFTGKPPAAKSPVKREEREVFVPGPGKPAKTTSVPLKRSKRKRAA